jgi:hypothetical protein
VNDHLKKYFVDVGWYSLSVIDIRQVAGEYTNDIMATTKYYLKTPQETKRL